MLCKRGHFLIAIFAKYQMVPKHAVTLEGTKSKIKFIKMDTAQGKKKPSKQEQKCLVAFTTEDTAGSMGQSGKTR